MKVLVREPIAEAGIDFLRERFDVDVDSDGDLGARIADYDAIIIRSGTHLDAGLIEKAERLKVIGRAGVGIDNVDLDAASRRGIVVANAPESTIVSAAEHTLGLLLGLSRSIPQAHAALKEGRWDRSRFAGHELAGKTLGLVGFGRIGRQVARLARGFDMRVLAFDPYVSADRFSELGVEQVDTLADLLAGSDFASLHLTLTEDTQGLVGRDELAAAKEGIKLVNAARGELVDEAALVEALRSGKVAGAALDVFAEEPHLAAVDPARRPDQAKEGERGRRLPGPALTDQADELTLADGERELHDGADVAGVQWVGDVEPARLQHDRPWRPDAVVGTIGHSGPPAGCRTRRTRRPSPRWRCRGRPTATTLRGR